MVLEALEYRREAVVRFCEDDNIKYKQIKRMFIVDDAKVVLVEELEAEFDRHLMSYEINSTGKQLICFCKSIARPGVLHPKIINGKTYITEKDTPDIDWCSI